MAANLNLRTEDAQNLLELFNTPERLKKVNDLLARELALTTVQAKIQTDVKDEISKNQRDYYLREQVKAIHRELGESDDKLAEIHEFKARIKRCKLPKECEEEAVKQLRRLEQMHSDSSEASVVRTYLDTIVELPWNKFSKEVLDIARARDVLDKNHFGLDKVKERILEYLSVRKLNPRKKGQIICFVGPPGVGKTSLGQAIAKAMNESSPGVIGRHGGTRLRSGGIAGPISAPCPAGFFRGCANAAPTIRCSCSTKSTSWAMIFGEILHPPCWRRWTRNRTSHSPIII